MGLIGNQGIRLVYISTGPHDLGDNLQIFNSLLENFYSSERIGNGSTKALNFTKTNLLTFFHLWDFVLKAFGIMFFHIVIRMEWYFLFLGFSEWTNNSPKY